MQALVYTVIGLISLTTASAERLTCKGLERVLVSESSVDVRPFCDTAEIRCKALTLLEKTPRTDPLRQILEIKLQAQVEYELEVCELALRKANPSYLNPREE